MAKRSFFRRAKLLDGHPSANLYNAIDNLIDSALEELQRLEPSQTHHRAALGGKITAYRECRRLLFQSRRYRPNLLGDPPWSACSVEDGTNG